MTFLFLIWPQQLLPLLPEWLLLIRPQELPWWPPLTSGVLVHYWELPSYYIYTPIPSAQLIFTLSCTILTHLFKSVEVVLHVWVFRGSNHQRKSKGIPIPNLGILYLLLRVTLILHLHTRSHQSLQLRYILHYHLESWLNYSGVSWSCHSSECLEVQFTWANEKGILFATLISGILVSFWELPSYYIYTPYDPHPFTSTAFTLSFRSKSHLFKRALRLSFMRVFRGSSNHSKSKGILLQTIQVAKLFL